MNVLGKHRIINKLKVKDIEWKQTQRPNGALFRNGYLCVCEL